MFEELNRAELFQGLGAARIQRLAAIGRPRTLRGGEYLFLLGDSAQNICVVTKGKVDLCFPIHVGGTVRDISIESAGPGQTVGWSALVKPYRFTLSARAAEPSEVVAFGRQELMQVFEADPGTGCQLATRVSELVGIRLSTFQALWARELTRTLESSGQPAAPAQ